MGHLPRSKGCFVCGQPEDNPRTLGLKFSWNEETHRTETEIAPDSTWCGYEGIVHGGVIASVFDDAMGWAVRQETGTWSVTGELTVRYVRPVLSGGRYTVEGWVEKAAGRRIAAAAFLADKDGTRLAEAKGLFFHVRQENERSPRS